MRARSEDMWLLNMFRRKSRAASEQDPNVRRWQQMALSDEDARLVENALPDHKACLPLRRMTDREFMSRLKRVDTR